MREPTSTRVFIADRRSVLLSEGVAGARARGATLGPCLRWLTLCLLAGVSVCDPPAPSWAPEAPTDNGTCHASKLRRLRAPRRQTVNGACADADVLPGVYTSDMVLQGGPDVCLSGGGPAEGLVAVAAPDGALAAADDCAVCPAGAARAAGGPGAEGGAVCGRVEAQGRCGWRACFGALPVGPAPLTLRVCPRAAPPRTLTNVLVGDVYLCAGQSNMAFALAAELAQRHILRPPELHAPYAPDAAAPAGADPGPAPAAADYVTDDPLVRYRNARDPFVPFWFAGDRNVTRRRNRGDVWTWRPVLDFSSACYHFARALRRRQPRRPVGLLQFAVGGAPIAAFLTAFSRSLCPSPQGVPTASVDGGAAARRAARAPVHIDTPKAGSLVPDFWGLVQHVRVAAVLWYQGEAEVMANKRYLTAMQVRPRRTECVGVSPAPALEAGQGAEAAPVRRGTTVPLCPPKKTFSQWLGTGDADNNPPPPQKNPKPLHTCLSPHRHSYTAFVATPSLFSLQTSPGFGKSSSPAPSSLAAAAAASSSSSSSRLL